MQSEATFYCIMYVMECNGRSKKITSTKLNVKLLNVKLQKLF